MTNERVLRQDLAAVFRLVHGFNWHESVSNHLSAAVSQNGQLFLMNRRWMHFSHVSASNLMLLDSNDTEVMERENAPDPSAWCIHGTIHRLKPDARVILHFHAPYATALSCLKDPVMYPIDNNTARFFGQIAYDREFGGMADQALEGNRLVRCLAEKKILMMCNHGVLFTADTIAKAFEDMYFFERAAKTLILAYASGKDLNILSDEIAEKTAKGWLDYEGMAYAHFDQLKQKLDKEEPDYAE